MQYDQAIIYKFAERLYRRASTIAFLYGFVGLIAGALAGAAAGAALGASNLGGGILAGLLLGMGIGAAIGIERGFTMRLQAQQALCQVKIEEHTRYVAMVHSANVSAQAAHGAPPGAQQMPQAPR
jgi:hypothetical protein